MRGAGNSSSLTLSPKGVRCCMAQRPRIYGGLVAHLPDMGRPTCGSARLMYAGWPHETARISLGPKLVTCRSGALLWETTLNWWKKKLEWNFCSTRQVCMCGGLEWWVKKVKDVDLKEVWTKGINIWFWHGWEEREKTLSGVEDNRKKVSPNRRWK